MISFRTRGNFIDFVLIEDTSLQDEYVLLSLHNTSKAIDWSYDENPLTITFTINEAQYSNLPISSIDFDGTTLTTQAGFETNIEAMFPNLAGGEGGGSSYLVYTALLSQSGTDAPAATVQDGNTIGNIVWSRTDIGDYLGTLSSAFTNLKTLCFITVGNNDPLGPDGFWVIFYRNNDNTVRMQCFGFAGGTVEPRELNSGSTTSIRIEVYP